MKKKIAMAALLAALILALVACGEKTPTTTGTLGTPTAPATATPVITPLAATTAKGLKELGQYKGLEVEKIALEVTDNDVLLNIYSSLEEAAEEKTDVEAKLYDFVNIDFVGTIDGVAFEGGSTDPSQGGTNVMLGSDSFVPGFEEGIVGMKAGETKTIKITFPETYKADLAGKDAEFAITLNKLKVLPEITDELVAANTSYETVDAFKAAVRSSLEERATQTIESQFESDVFDKLLEGCSFDLEYLQPKFEEYENNMLKNYTESAAMYGIDLEYFVYLSFGITLEAFRQQLPVVAEYNIKLEKVLIAIAEEEKMTVTDAEYDEYVSKVLAQTNYENKDDFESYYSPEYIKEGILIERAQELVLNSAIAK